MNSIITERFGRITLGLAPESHADGFFFEILDNDTCERLGLYVSPTKNEMLIWSYIDGIETSHQQPIELSDKEVEGLVVYAMTEIGRLLVGLWREQDNER